MHPPAHVSAHLSAHPWRSFKYPSPSCGTDALGDALDDALDEARGDAFGVARDDALDDARGDAFDDACGADARVPGGPRTQR